MHALMTQPDHHHCKKHLTSPFSSSIQTRLDHPPLVAARIRNAAEGLRTAECHARHSHSSIGHLRILQEPDALFRYGLLTSNTETLP